MRSKSTTESTRRVALYSALGSIAALGVLSACDSTPLNMGAGGAAGVSGSAATVLHTRTNSFTIFPGGSSGMAGSAGASGNAGSAGSSGVSGSSGSSGSSGTSGASGTSGTSGSSGSASSGGSGITQCVPTQPPDPATVTPELVSPRTADPHNVPLPSRTIGAGRHSLATGCNSVGVVFADHGQEPPNLLLSTYYPNGLFRNTTPIAQATISTPDPGVAGLPDDSFAVAWTDFGADNDELGILLQKLAANGAPQGEPMVANEGSAFSQSNSDIVFDGSELVVAWADSSDASSGPDLRYRLFSPDLTPLTGDVILANTSAAEDDVVLAGQGGQWAAAWRSASNGVEGIEVQSGATHWTIGGFMPGKTGDRPDLAFLDATHLAVAFTMGTDPSGTGVADVPRLHGAVLDFAFPGQALSFELPPAEDSYAASPSWSQSEPSLVVTPDHLQVAWRAGQLAGDANATELWSRRYPITLNSDHSVTIDTSHVATPVIQTAAQRAGDQNAFRMLGTNLWPSGGLFAAWDDASHSFGAVSGVPDVALQFFPGFTEPQLPVTTYHLSADGRYYLVNLLKRNYPPISALAVYSGGAFQYSGYGPLGVVDGDDQSYIWQVPPANDLSSGSILTIDLGRVYSIGAVEPAYAATNRMPLNHSIRLALTAGNWTTVVPVTTTTTADTVYSNFAPMQARYLELKMMGSPVANGLPAVSELFVYPSAQQTPGPTTADGYDIGYLGKLSVNGNFQPPIAPLEWPTTPVAPKTLAQGATGDAVATLDLGGQYPLSRVSVGFQNSVTWASGGRVDVAAIPDAYTTVYDSGAGQQFGPAAALGTCQEFYFPLQLVRYVRLTDYFIPGSGPSGGTVWSIQAYTTPAATPLNYPLSADGKYFTVNLLRRPTTFTQPTATVVYANGALVYTPNPVGQIPANIFDGDDLSFGWRTATPTSAATATVTIDLGQVESIGAMRQVYSGPLTPTAYSVRIAQSLGTWTQLIPDTLTTTWDFSTSFAAASARYVELTMRGSPAQNIVSLAELFLFPSSATTPAPVSTDALDHTYLTGMNYTLNSNMLYGGDGTYSRVQQKDFYGKPLAQGSNGDAILTYDLGQEYQVSQVDLAFYLNQNWPEGGKVEAGDGSGNWSTVFDSGVGNAFGPPSSAGNGGSVSMPFTTRTARYIRLTGYFVPGVGAARGMIQNVEVF